MKQLVFVYNANIDLFSSVTDFAHKIISPSTYQCNLCTLTYGKSAMKNEWRNFIQQLTVKTIFLHKNEFKKSFHFEVNLPAVFIKENDRINLFISKEEIDNCKSLQQLKTLVASKLALHDKHHHSNI